MSVTAVVGANWGDEGKGKITDFLAGDSEWVVRYQGGSNAGHTIVNQWGKFALHLLPSGVFYPHVSNVIGPGVAVNLSLLLDELDALQARGVPLPKLLVSERAQVVLPVHLLLDRLEEERLGASQFGSTRSGIAPFYADKALKTGIQIADLFIRDRLQDRIGRCLDLKNPLLVHGYHQLPVDSADLLNTLQADALRIAPYVADTTALLQQAVSRGERILLEGQLGALRDPDHGIYPFTTSSSPLAGYASVGAGIPPYALRRIIAVTKAYSTCVGAGPLVTELVGAEAQTLRERGGDGGEYGATTGRSRRVGWFDAVATRYGTHIQGATEVALTNLDVLSHWQEIPLAVGYRLDGKVEMKFPNSTRLAAAEPIWETCRGWGTDISAIRDYRTLPQPAREYVERIEELLDIPMRLISVGPRREQMLVKP